jgi:hypothetical protein
MVSLRRQGSNLINRKLAPCFRRETVLVMIKNQCIDFVEYVSEQTLREFYDFFKIYQGFITDNDFPISIF